MTESYEKPDSPRNSPAPSSRPTGYLSLTLHAHLPWVINHGTWPHGMEWLHEATAETYLPLLRVFRNLERDGIALHCNLNLSPILLEQLAHPVFIAEFPKYLARKIVAAREDEAFFVQSGENHYAELARFWHRFFTEALASFDALNHDIVSGFRHFHQAGLIDIVTCAATHGYLPLLGTDESIRAQVCVGIDAHSHHIGAPPRGIWSPECGYRPTGLWNYPVLDQGATKPHPAFTRMGIEQIFAQSGLAFFYVDTHLVEESQQGSSPYSVPRQPTAIKPQNVASAGAARNLYRPYLVQSSYHEPSQVQSVAIFARDPRTGMQVWSGERGYPGDGNYLDFHKKRWPGGHRYWRVTDTQLDMKEKLPYFHEQAAERVQTHAAHFVRLVRDALASSLGDPLPPILSAPFDAELFGHWWFEGASWLEAVARELHHHPSGIALITSTEYLDRYPASDSLAMPEGSWGAGGNDHVWLNPETAWTYTYIYPAERYVREVCTNPGWRSSPLATGIVQQLCRELLLLESSDWQFLITTGAARDYAELRFHTHHEQFLALKDLWQTLESSGGISAEQQRRLSEIQIRDSIFPHIDPSLWAIPEALLPAKPDSQLPLNPILEP